MDKKHLVFRDINIITADLVYFNRKFDQELSSNDLLDLLDSNKLTIEEMANFFKGALEAQLSAQRYIRKHDL
jgi:hypothetical protein